MAAPRDAKDLLPKPMRYTVVAAILFSSFVGFNAVREIALLTSTAPMRIAVQPDLGHPALSRIIGEKFPSAYQQALESVQLSRSFILAGLAVAATLVFLCAARLLRPAGLPRGGVRQLLGGSALAAAVLRVIDGAQHAAVLRRVGAVLDEALAEAGALADFPFEGFMSMGLVGITVGFTALSASGFLVISAYFRSERVKQIVALSDLQTGAGQE